MNSAKRYKRVLISSNKCQTVSNCQTMTKKSKSQNKLKDEAKRGQGRVIGLG